MDPNADFDDFSMADWSLFDDDEQDELKKADLSLKRVRAKGIDAVRLAKARKPSARKKSDH